MMMRSIISAAALAGLAACGGEADTMPADNGLVIETVPTDEAVLDDESLANADAEPMDGEADIPASVNPQAEIRPVRVGGDGPDLDACGGYGEVTGLNPNGDNFLAVRASPFVGAYELDRLEPGQGVSMCDYEGGWVGIVYDKSGDADCGTGSPVASERDYEGPCESGWVSEDFVTLLAG